MEEADYLKTVFSDLTFMLAADPYKVQSNSASATLSIQEDPTIKVIFAATGAQMKVSATTTTGKKYTITLVIHKSQV